MCTRGEFFEDSVDYKKFPSEKKVKDLLTDTGKQATNDLLLLTKVSLRPCQGI